jgi:hypothetical protein
VGKGAGGKIIKITKIKIVVAKVVAQLKKPAYNAIDNMLQRI